MFKRNIEVIKTKNPELAQKLESMKIEDIKGVDVYKADSGDLIINYKDINLHNSVDPIREAKSAWLRRVKEDLRPTDIQVVLGLGLGYLFKRAYVQANSKILIYEPYLDVLRFVLEYVDFSKELSDKRVFLTTEQNTVLEYIEQNYLPGDKLKLLYLNSYAQLENEPLIELSKHIFEVCEQRNADKNTNLMKSKKWCENSILNVSKFDESFALNLLKDSFKNKTAVVISAGPSLAQDIELIKANQGKYVVIAAAKALSYLLTNSIKPDFTVFTDEDYFDTIIDGIEDQVSDLNFVLDFRADTKAFSSKLKNKFIYFSSTNNIALSILNTVKVEEINVLPSAGSSSLTCFYVAKELGCNKVIFEGLDLSFVDKKSYVGNLTLAKNQNDFVKVKSVTGKMVETRSDYALFIRQFEDTFKTEEDIEIINTSLKGANIEGMKYLNASDVYASLPEQALETDNKIKDAINNKKAIWVDFTQKVRSYLKEKETLLIDYKQTLDSLVAEWNEIDEALAQENIDVPFIQNKYEKIQDDMSLLRTQITLDPFVVYFMQKELLEYAEMYSTKVIQDAESVKNNLKLESELTRYAFASLESILAVLKKVI